MHRCARVLVVSLMLVAPAAAAFSQTIDTTANRADTAARVRGTARVTGTVRSAGGREVGHVGVRIIGMGRETRTSERGRFTFDSLPAAMFTLEAVNIGSMPGRVVVDLVADQSTTADITLGKGIPVLETREISAVWTSEIERRARVSTMGSFIKPAEVAARGRNTPLANLLYQTPSVYVACARPSQCSVTMRATGTTTSLGPRYCTPSLYIDGFRDRFADFASIYSGDILAVEIYRELGRPFEFLDSNKCGAVAVWMKPFEPRKKKRKEPSDQDAAGS